MNEYAVMPLEDYENACDTIRNKTYGVDNIKSGELSKKVEEVFNKGNELGFGEGYERGFSNGESQGYEQGHSEGLEQGVEQGKQSEYDRFWDIYQQNGERTNYYTGFSGTGWTVDNFKPKYDIIPEGNCYMMFINSQIQGDLVEILDNLGVTLDFSKCDTITYAFSATLFTRVGVVACNIGNQVANLFQNSRQLVTVDKLIIKNDGSQTYSNPFANCIALKNITIEGVIGQNVSFQHSPLTVSSMNNIISCLKDYSSTGGTHTLTLKKDRETMLTAEEKAVATNKGWTLVWS